MNKQVKFQADLTVRSFAHVVERLSHTQDTLSPSAQYARILGEAERHQSALRLLQRDIFTDANQALRERSIPRAKYERTCDMAAKAVEQAHIAINRIAARYLPHRMAA